MPAEPRPARLRLLHLLGLVLAILQGVAVGLGPAADVVPRWLPWQLLALLPLVVLALQPGLAAPGTRRPSLRPLGAILFWAAMMRLAPATVDVSLSDDIFRYVWEGRVTALGGDPYDFGPEAPELAGPAAEAPEWPLINHRELPAIYPPGAQWLFAALAALRPDVELFRAAMILVDLAVIAMLALLLQARRLPVEAAVLYAWHPLAVIETGSSGHYEPWAMLPMLGGLLAWQLLGPPGSLRSGGEEDRSPRNTGESVAARAPVGARVLPWALWGAALATKFLGALPAGFAGLQLLRRGRWGAAALAGFVLLGTFAVFALPFAADGSPPLGSLGTYARHWGHNGSIYALLVPAVGYHPARKVVAVLFVLWLAWVARREDDPVRGTFLVVGGLILLSPVVHPWYGLWVLVLVPLVGSAPWVLLSGLLPLSYLAFAQQASGRGPQAPGWVPWVEYGLPLLLWAWLRARARRRAGGHAEPG